MNIISKDTLGIVYSYVNSKDFEKEWDQYVQLEIQPKYTVK